MLKLIKLSPVGTRSRAKKPQNNNSLKDNNWNKKLHSADIANSAAQTEMSYSGLLDIDTDLMTKLKIL